MGERDGTDFLKSTKRLFGVVPNIKKLKRRFGVGEVPIEFTRPGEDRAGLQIAGFKAGDRQDLALVTGAENLVGVVEIGNVQLGLHRLDTVGAQQSDRSEEHTSELQSH